MAAWAAQGVRGAAAGGPQPQAGTQAALKHAGERFTTEDAWGNSRPCLMRRAPAGTRPAASGSRAARRTSGPAPRLPGFSAR